MSLLLSANRPSSDWRVGLIHPGSDGSSGYWIQPESGLVPLGVQPLELGGQHGVQVAVQPVVDVPVHSARRSGDSFDEPARICRDGLDRAEVRSADTAPDPRDHHAQASCPLE